MPVRGRGRVTDRRGSQHCRIGRRLPKTAACLAATDACGVIRTALGSAGVEFIEENGGGPGVRLRKRQQKKG